MSTTVPTPILHSFDWRWSSFASVSFCASSSSSSSSTLRSSIWVSTRIDASVCVLSTASLVSPLASICLRPLISCFTKFWTYSVPLCSPLPLCPSPTDARRRFLPSMSSSKSFMNTSTSPWNSSPAFTDSPNSSTKSITFSCGCGGSRSASACARSAFASSASPAPLSSIATSPLSDMIASTSWSTFGVGCDVGLDVGWDVG